MARRKKRYALVFEDYHVVHPNYIRRNHLGDFTGPAIEQLAAYEATELTPSQTALMQKEVQLLQTKVGSMEHQVETLEAELMIARSEREYFRSRAEFLQEVTLRGGK